jgi:large conductance mechanosensitive channel
MEENIKKPKIGQGLLLFLKEYSVIGLAIGMVIGQVSTNLINSIVKGVFTPLIELIVPGKKFSGLIFNIRGVSFDIGSVISNTITFFIVLILLYVIIKKILKQDELIKKK